MIGTSQSPELAGLAARYCWIRASVTPLALMGMVAETNCLANVDTKTPAIAVLSASIVNVIGDLALAFWGMQGAALATAVATVTSATIMLRKVKARKEEWRQKELLSGSNGNHDTATDDTADISSMAQEVSSMNGEELAPNGVSSSSGLKKTKSSDDIPFLSLPDRTSIISLLKLSFPMFYTMLGKIACYSAMSIRATDFGVVNLAAHSIMMRLFFFFACFGDSLSQSAQSFLPKALYPKPNDKDLRHMLKRLLIFATCVGLFISQTSGWVLSNLGGYLTNDKAVVATIAKHSKLLSLSLLLHPFIMLGEGTLTATRDFKKMISFYTITMVTHFSLLALAVTSFPHIWKALFLFQSLRLTLFGTRVIQRVTSKKTSAQQ
jgi:Na+-driven multidrug efflux pump